MSFVILDHDLFVDFWQLRVTSFGSALRKPAPGQSQDKPKSGEEYPKNRNMTKNVKEQNAQKATIARSNTLFFVKQNSGGRGLVAAMCPPVASQIWVPLWPYLGPKSKNIEEIVFSIIF